MNDTYNRLNQFVGYEYLNVTVGRELEAMYTDAYPNFGWELEGSTPALAGPSRVTLNFKRDRRIRNKAELTRLQRKFDSDAGQLVQMEKSKRTTASIVAYVIGLLGCAFVAGATFAFLGSLIPLMVILAVPGFIGWVLPYFCCQSIEKRKSEELMPLIDQKHDEIYEVYEKANALLA